MSDVPGSGAPSGERRGPAAAEPAAAGEPGPAEGATGRGAGAHDQAAGAQGAASAEHDAIEQLQRAVLTAIGATRVVLDALEAVVADRRRIEQLSASGRDALGALCSLLGQRQADGPPRGDAAPQDGAENT